MPGTRIHAEPDYAAAFFASNPGTSLCVIAGTGSLVCTKVEGKIVKGGGRGYLLGDEGSAYAYGRAALNHYLDDPSQASGELKQAVEKLFGMIDSTEVIAEVYQMPTPASHLAKLSKAFGSDVQHGEPYALQALQEDSRALAAVVERHVRHAHPAHEIRICLVGGLWKGTTVFSKAFETHLKELLPNRIEWVQRTNTPPVYGAVAISKEIFG
jgi:N-acetylglucosamine kinase-like BadF-type ATPase